MLKHTPGPWGWFGNAGHQGLYLSTVHHGRRFVMNFRRWGFRNAQPAFQVDGRMVPAADLLTFEVGEPGVVGVDAAKADQSVYRLDIRGIDHPDARLIAAAPTLYALLADIANGDLADTQAAIDRIAPTLAAIDGE